MAILKRLCTALLVFQTSSALAEHTGARLEIKELNVGTGAPAVRHSKVKLHYTGWLLDGAKFDSSRDRGEALEFTLGTGQVIPGWDMGIGGMRTGGRRKLIIPPELAYGKKGAGSVIPPDATLKFEVELISMTPPKYTNISNNELKAMLARGVKIIDVRRADEWRTTGVVKNSRLLTAFDESGRFVTSFPRDLRENSRAEEEVILICRTGNRSSALAHMLTEQAGYTRVYNVTDGILKWLKEGNPVDK